jgi:hypothetical protein
LEEQQNNNGTTKVTLLSPAKFSVANFAESFAEAFSFPASLRLHFLKPKVSFSS